ncbi:BlaI/MecI/CopY family transcriptional regulator [Terriglobus saanensis]|uniref:BlaI/MecI/CopY family transcriptional regulator n=1 Tax=Terriglobus saanensis TaxID=870903 RepID=UPI001FE21428|nr:BlaI/MecI/CopY family transcriptional regulator [Terriglobus saanensis]
MTEAELRLMRLLWRCGECFVQDLVSAMPAEGRLAYNSVLTTIRILETKGYVEHRQEGRAFLYTAVVAEEDAQQSEVRNVISRFFGDSRERLMLALLGGGDVSLDELQALKRAIAEAEAAAGQKTRRKSK